MKIIDLTHTISNNMPVFPGTERPVFTPANTLAQNGFIEAKITMYSHTGTHIDAPAHMFEKGTTLDSFNIEHFVGLAAVLDFSKQNLAVIGINELQPFAPIIAGTIEFIILKTGWEQYWGSEKYLNGFPCLSEEAASWLTRFNLKGIGIDAISIDPVDSTTFGVHKILMQSEVLIIENLANLNSINSPTFLFFALPLKTKDADGSPIRAVAIQL